MDAPLSVLELWTQRLREFLPQLMEEQPALAAAAGCSVVILHGSTTMGIDDAASDLDLWVLTSTQAAREFDRRSPTRFIEFRLNDKPGHANIELADEFARRVRDCDMQLIAELRRAVVLFPNPGGTGRAVGALRPCSTAVSPLSVAAGAPHSRTGVPPVLREAGVPGEEGQVPAAPDTGGTPVLRECGAPGAEIAFGLIDRACRPMRSDVRLAWFRYHYVEMRGEHRACDTPIDRGDSIALLQALVPTLSHAMRAAMVLDGVPYPYIKWLAKSASATPTGAKVVPLVNDIIDLLGQGALRIAGPEKVHPLNLKLREIRQVLIDAAHADGIDEPWLRWWYLHMPQARDGIREVEW